MAYLCNYETKDTIGIFSSDQILCFLDHLSEVMVFAVSLNDINMKRTNEEKTDDIEHGSKELACKLTAPELRRRRETVIANFKKQVIEKKELDNGFAYRFNGSDNIIDELSGFIKTERICCDFFEFNLSVSGRPDNPLWFTITGPEGIKDFVLTEIGL